MFTSAMLLTLFAEVTRMTHLSIPPFHQSY